MSAKNLQFVKIPSMEEVAGEKKRLKKKKRTPPLSERNSVRSGSGSGCCCAYAYFSISGTPGFRRKYGTNAEGGGCGPDTKRRHL